MKLAAIYCVWDGCELLKHSIKSILPHVDLIIIVYQDISNFGEAYSPMPEIESLREFSEVEFVKFDPVVEYGGGVNETRKRNLGIDFARANNCTHFLALDVDELYEDFGAAKQLYIQSGHKGSVCRLHTYFRKPIFRFDVPENYFVPFIHELSENTKTGMSTYRYYVDPTRAINESDIVELPIWMHHFSWCRKDIMRKANNSSAKIQIKKGKILDDYNSPDLGEGYFLTNWNRRIKIVPDQFGLSHIFD